MDRHFTAKQARATKAPKHEIGVGDSDFFAAPVTSRSGISACRLGSHTQRSGGVDPGDRSSSGSHRVNVDHRHGHRQTGHQSLVRGARLSAAKGGVGRGSTHVEGYDVAYSHSGADSQRANDASGGARENRSDGFGSSGPS